MSNIPLVLHQTYKDRRLPHHLKAYQESWRHHNPHWQYKFWSDQDIDDFVAKEFPEFLPIFDAYTHKIMRIDAFRYLLLYHQGGIYADMDFECLRPMDELLKGRDIFLISEPQQHTEGEKARKRNLDIIVSNALFACRPRHPFLGRLINYLRQYRPQSHKSDLLDATGPFILTALHHSYKPRIRLAPESYFNAIYHDGVGSSLRNYTAEPKRTKQYGQHHWEGSWWQQDPLWEISTYLPRQAKFLLFKWFSYNRKIKKKIFPPLAKSSGNLQSQSRKRASLLPSKIHTYSLTQGKDPCREADFSPQLAAKTLDKVSRPGKSAAPKVSALMVTRGRPQLALTAIDCFLKQSYPNKELVIVEQEKPVLHKLLKENNLISGSNIRYECVGDKKISLGNVRNISLDLAQGDYVCTWDDDDLYHPQRIQYQLTACLQYSAVACFLLRVFLLAKIDAQQGSYSLSPGDLGKAGYRLWESTMLGQREVISRYPNWNRHEDNLLNRRIITNHKVVSLNLPELYLYHFHYANTWNSRHHQRIWENASRIFLLPQDLIDQHKLLCTAYPQLRGQKVHSI